ncbi:MAG: gas vesicle protein K [Pseudomonadota bacterium]
MNASIEQALAQAMGSRSETVALDGEGTANGLLKLALTIVRFLHDVLEKQAVARMESGSLTDEQIEKVGTCLMKQAQQISALCKEHGIDPDELELDLGPLGRL